MNQGAGVAYRRRAFSLRQTAGGGGGSREIILILDMQSLRCRWYEEMKIFIRREIRVL